ncbi:MAG: 2-phospho-L-lactate guanylyltransferase [Methanophagales archaeon]|jgi:2-phospho-L-lactate guanylyltransferase|nr:2-phospho-L-lactate guanylyltransferase [Methanophagales archaeon]
MNSVKAIIPFKKKGAKTRLRTLLTEAEREELAIRMLKDVLVSLSESQIEEVEIISMCSKEELLNELKLELHDLKLTVRVDEKGLNEVLNEVIGDEKDPRLIIMADIPLVTPESINGLIGYDADVVIAPGRKGGTNALFMRKPCEFVVSYYGVSYLEHIETAKRRNLSYIVHDSFFISADIDEDDDLMELLIHGKYFSAEYLRMIGVVIQVDKKSKLRARVDRQMQKQSL